MNDDVNSKDGNNNSEKSEDVFTAGNYDLKKCLIGPELFDTYLLVLKIVLIAVGVGLLIAKTIQLAGISSAVDSGGSEILSAFMSLIGGLWSGLLSAFGMVTLIFAMFERFSDAEELQKMKEDFIGKGISGKTAEKKEKTNKTRIKLGDPIATIIFSLFFLIAINLIPELFGLYRQGEAGIRITAFLGAGFSRYLIWINIVLVLGIVLEMIKIIYGRWTLSQVAAGLIQNTLSIIVSLLVIRDPQFINPSFVNEINKMLAEAGANFSVNWSSGLITVLTILVILGYLIDTISIAYKGWYLRTETIE